MSEAAVPDPDSPEGRRTGAPVTRRALLVGGAVTAVRVRRAAAQNPAAPAAPQALDDASRLNRVSIARHWRPTQVTGDLWLDALRAELKAAASQGRPVSVGAARHSMGGQALPPDGVAMTFDVNVGTASAWIEPNREARTYRVAAGARWSQVIRALDPTGYSPAVMQSNNDFGAAATLSVNAHGWPVPYGPFGATVRSFRLMLASGELVTCTPVTNADLFGLANGGYGLLGVVVDLELTDGGQRPAEADLTSSCPPTGSGLAWPPPSGQDATVRMAYGRLAVDAARFLREALLVTYRPEPGTPPPVRSGGLVNAVSREMFRAQIGSDTAKRARWHAETVTAPRMMSGVASRNTLLNEPVANLAGRDPKRTDILHEYFLPPENLEGFLAACRVAIPGSRQDLLNVTLRYVEEDRRSVLAYARGTRIAAVMLFSQRMTRTDDEDMAALTAASRSTPRSTPAAPTTCPTGSTRAAISSRAPIRASRNSRWASADTTRECCSATSCGTATSARDGGAHPMNPLRWIAIGYAVLFAGVASLNYIPGVRDAQGLAFGLFALDVFDDLLHAASSLWAGLSAWRGTRATVIFFRIFGPLYCADGLLGLATGSGYLDLGIFVNGVLHIPLDDPHPAESASHRDRRIRGLHRVRAGAALGARRDGSPPLACAAGRGGPRWRSPRSS